MPLFNRKISLSERDNKMDDRRSNGRTRITKAASLFFGGQTGVHSCDVNLTDITNGGAGIYKRGLAVTFELSFDNLRRKCRLVWRRGNFFGVAFENQSLPSDSANQLGEGDIVIPEPAFSILNEPPPQPAYFGNAENTMKMPCRAPRAWSDPATLDPERRRANRGAYTRLIEVG